MKDTTHPLYTRAMLTCRLMGGLGNQLFQIFATIAASLKSGQMFVFNDRATTGPRPTYWTTFFKNLKPYCSTVNHIPDVRVQEMPRYVPLDTARFAASKEKVIMLHGYFQSYRYFEKEYADICRMIGLADLKATVPLKLGVPYQRAISMHFRFGDYLKLPDHHPVQPIAYYSSALTHIRAETTDPIHTVLYFCESSDGPLVESYVRELSAQFPEYRFVRADPSLADWEQLLCMSACRHHIIANSTFSWWGAYFDDRADSIVCYPNHWFGPLVSADVSEMHPPRWERIYE